MKMSASRLDGIVRQIKDFSTSEKIELLRAILDEIIISDDHFSEDEIADIKLALEEAARGEWVDFDEFRKRENL
jgi:hypothetical protein